jgi:hypothetical protein
MIQSALHGTPAIAAMCLGWMCAGFFAISCASAHAECDARPGATRVEGRSAALVFLPRPSKIGVGEFFTLELSACAKKGEVRAIGVDAAMPEHRHGMNYKPAVTRAGAGKFSAAGLMFHMPGRWQLVFDVDFTEGRERMVYDMLIE